MESKIVIKTVSEEDRRTVTSIFVEAFYSQLCKLNKDITKLEKMFFHAFVLDRFLGAFLDEKLVGFFALTNESERCLRIIKTDFVGALGGVKGYFAHMALKKEFEHKRILRERGNAIECVAISKKYQGKGIATQLMNYAIENYDYLELDVLDTNQRAYEIYRRVGFIEYKEEYVSPMFRKALGYNKRIFMYYKKARRAP
jgi:ribosomal protein S18 acetylase RimI-like enzyme